MLICKQCVTSGVSKDFLTIVRGGDKDLKLPTGNLEFNVKLIINGIKLPYKNESMIQLVVYPVVGKLSSGENSTAIYPNFPSAQYIGIKYLK